MNIMDRNTRTLSPQESRVVLALAEEKRRDVSRAEIIELLGAKPKAADKVILIERVHGTLGGVSARDLPACLRNCRYAIGKSRETTKSLSKTSFTSSSLSKAWG
jgi:hypothetical protein